MARWYFWAGVTVMLGGTCAATVIVLREASSPRTQVRRQAPEREADPIERTVVERRIVVEQALPPPATAPDARIQASVESTSELTPKTADEAGAEVEARFEGDRGATAEARSAEATIRQVLMDPQLEGTTLEKLECRASTCRAKVTFANDHTDLVVTRRLLLDPASPLASLQMGVMIPFRETSDDGRVAATMYFYKEQPDPDQAGG